MKVQKVLIIYRSNTPEALELSKELAGWLNKKELQAFSCADQKISGCKPTTDISQIDLVIVLGGDGTYLEAVGRLEGRKTPILGVNLGSLGFLTSTPANQLFSIAEKAIRGDLEARPRAILEVEVSGSQSGLFTALNDIVLERGDQSHLINLKIFIDEHLVSELKADGLIFSSPTGSTAYNLAAGGPILHPEVKAFCLNPICPHSLTDRPIIFPEDREIRLEIVGQDKKARLTVDGRSQLYVTSNDKIVVRKANHEHYVLRKTDHNYFDLLREKLKFGERA